MGKATTILAAVALLGVGSLGVAAPDDGASAEVEVSAAGADATLAVDLLAQDSATTTAQAPVEDPDASAETDVEETAEQVEGLAEDQAAAVLERVHELPVDLDAGMPLLQTPPVAPDDPLVEEEASRGHAAVGGASPAPDAGSEGADATPSDGLLLAPAAAVATVTGAAAVSPRLRGWRGLLGLAPWTGLYTRIDREDLLDHETRQAAYDLLKRRPGCSMAEIADALDVARSTARHHVRKLVDASLIDHTTVGRSRIHYPAGREQEAVARHLLDNETRAQVAAELAGEPRSLSEIAEALDLNAGSVHFHLDKLCGAGLVERRENGSITYEAAVDAVENHFAFPAR